jgi:small conductance mechanosensitive channel
MDLSGIIESAMPVLTTWGLRIIGALAVFIIGSFVAKMIRGTLRKLLKRADVDETLTPFLCNVAYYGALAFVLIAVLGLFGVETTSLVAVLGAASFAIGLALQGTLSNFAAGVMLLLFRPFDVGDVISAGGVTGQVQMIGIFSSTFHTPDNRKIIVPNSKIYGDTIENVTALDTRRIDMTFGVGYNDDLTVAKNTIQKIAAEHPLTLSDPAVQVEIVELADSSVNFICRPWSKTGDYWTVFFDLQKQMKEGLEAAGCSIPYPQRDVHLHGNTSV